MLKINMLIVGFDFFTSQLNGQLLIFDTWNKQRCDNEQIVQGDFLYTASITC